MPDAGDTSRIELFTRCWLSSEATIRAYVRSAIRREADADDVVQDAAFRMARAFERYDSERPFVPWALTIARSAIIDHLRRAPARPVLGAELIEALGETHARLHPEITEVRRAIDHCLKRLPSRLSGIVRLRYHHDATPARIAEQMGTTSEAIRAALARARKRLAECVAAQLGPGFTPGFESGFGSGFGPGSGDAPGAGR